MKRTPHKLEATKTMHVPRRMIFFDSESQVAVAITDSEVERAIHGEEVWKEHDLYLIRATFYTEGTGGRSPRRRQGIYYPNTIKGVGEFEAVAGRQVGPRFAADYWADVDRFTQPGSVHTYVFAHNAKYDALVTGGVHYLIKEHGYQVEGFSDANPFLLRFEKVTKTEMRVRQDGSEYEYQYKKVIHIISSTNFYQQSLASLGKVFGLPKLDFAHGQPFDLESALIYCGRDVDILERAMLSFISFIQRENLGSFSKTVAGQAFKAYRHRFLQEPIYIHADDFAAAVERRAYAGGRTECFRMGPVGSELHYVDVNSMYPFVMKSKLYPTKLVTHWQTCTPETLKAAIQNGYLVCADVRVSTGTPVFHRKDKRLTFPIGDFWTTLSTPEIVYGFDNDLITECKNVCLYEAGYIFEHFVDYFYEKRLAAKASGDKVHDLLYKIIMNSLYGKFGQKNIIWSPCDTADPEEIGIETIYLKAERRLETFKTFGGSVWRLNRDIETEEAQDSFPAIAAHVTAYARILLLSYIECAGWEHVYYTDTDSLFVSLEGFQRLKDAGHLDNKILGKLKLEDKGFLDLYGCKDYHFRYRSFKESVKTRSALHRDYPYPGPHSFKKTYKESVKIKGVSKQAREIQKTEDGKLRFAVNQWTGFSERMKQKDFQGYYTKIIVKTLKRDYNKGHVQPDGRIFPFVLDYEQEAKDAYQAMLAETGHDLFIPDPIKHYCKFHGHIKAPRPGESYHGEYMGLPRSCKIKYFRLAGMAIDRWCDGVGWTVRELFDRLNDISLK